MNNLVVDQAEFWKMVEATKPANLPALSDEELRDCQNYFLETLNSTLPAFESVTASLRLILLRGEIDLRHSDARHRQTQRLARWAIRVGILSAVVILAAVVAIVLGLANRPTTGHVPVAATEAATETQALIPPNPAALPTATPTPATLATITPAPTASPTPSVVSTRTPSTQKKKTRRTQRKRQIPKPGFLHQLLNPE
ncbi:MAG: hypothetical protein DMF20_00270 [Verrucomicrobia bacterium]|nr:MAG: hypothetical protein DMF20_00270 [Verrucomicrobiota bacterium]